jgi:IclR family transcriptional regulator, KDG regulon repressor
MPGGTQYQVRALERALRILDCFSSSTPELSLNEIALQADLPRSTAFRLLAVLADHGFIDRSTESESYRIGFRAFELGNIYAQTISVEAEARPYLHQLAVKCRQTANLGVLNRGEVVHIAVVPPDRPIHFSIPVGDREKAHCSGLGKVLISELSHAALADLIEQHPLVRHTDQTITDPVELATHLDAVRDQGFAIDDRERFPDLKCVAAPIRNDRGQIVAALSVSGLAQEFDLVATRTFIDEVKDAAVAVSGRLGYSPCSINELEGER